MNLELSKNDTDSRSEGAYIAHMPFPIHILTTERDGDDGLIVTFSDGTMGAYGVEELLELRPFRDRVETKSSAKSQNSR